MESSKDVSADRETIELSRRALVRGIALGTAGLALGTALPAPSAAAARPKGRLAPTAIFDIGVLSYIYGYPLVLMGVTKAVATNVVNGSEIVGRAPVNQISNNLFPKSGYTDVVLPSTTTLYQAAWLDLSDEPVILHLPDITFPDGTDRFFVIQVLDAWTEVGGLDPDCVDDACTTGAFCSLGSRYGTREGYYAFVGPDWKGDLPEGITRVIQMRTNLGWIIGRIYTTGTEDDVAHIEESLYPEITLTPLSGFPPPYTPPDAIVDPTINMIVTPLDQVAAMRACAFFGSLAALMGPNPPAEVDERTVKLMAHIGLEPGQPFDCSDRRTLVALEAAVDAAQRIMSQSPQLSLTTTGWSMPLGIGTYGTKYLQRALIAERALGANLTEDAVYGGAIQDADGQPLSGAYRYVMHLAADALPPIDLRAFWSVTMYNMPLRNLVDNSYDRYAVGWPAVEGREPCFNGDGSLDVYIQRDPPGDPDSIEYCNWLPAPEGNFLLFLRMYWPLLELDGDGKQQVKGKWEPPAVQRLESLDSSALLASLLSYAAGLPIQQSTRQWLLASLQSIKESLARGNRAAARNQLQALLSKVAAQRDKRLPAFYADTLIQKLQQFLERI
jgi:hypothetical protein